MTRRTAVLSVLTVLAVAAAALHATAAEDRVRIRRYAGETSQGGLLELEVTVRDGVVRLRELNVEGSVTCEDGTGFAFGSGIDYGGSGPILPEQQLHVEEVFLDTGFILSGRLGAHRGSGTWTHAFALLDAAEQAQVCSTGELTWQVERVFVPSAPRTAGIVITARSRGIVSTTLLQPRVPSINQVVEERRRHYEGRTSQGRSMSVVTVRREDGIALRTIDFGWNLACEDGTSFDFAMGITFGDPVPTAPPTTLDLDDVFFSSALHVHGDLGPHAGSGIASEIIAILTPDLDAQRCSSGDLTWRAWRIDEGA